MLTRILASTAMVLASGGTASAAQNFNDKPPNAPEQTPAFKEQTRAPMMPNDIALQARPVAEGLVHPWGMAELPGDQGWLVTERPGTLRHIAADGTLSKPLTGLPDLDTRGQGGLLDIALGPDFSDSRRVFFSFAQPRGDDKNATAVARATLNADLSALEDVTVIFQQQPAWKSDKHFGSRLVFDRDGNLFVTMGERSDPDPRALAQNLDNHLGKIVHITQDGQPVAAEPAIPGALPDIYAMGLRNVQAAALGPNGDLWTIEHGPQGGDELNHIKAGLNYGWPVITYGEDYDGTPLGEGITAKDGMEQPIYYWDPVIAPAGMVFYDGDMFPDWKGQILTGGLQAEALVRLKLDGDKVIGEARALQDIGRVRDVDVASDGAIMLLTDKDNGALVRVTPE